ADLAQLLVEQLERLARLLQAFGRGAALGVERLEFVDRLGGPGEDQLEGEGVGHGGRWFSRRPSSGRSACGPPRASPSARRAAWGPCRPGASGRRRRSRPSRLLRAL